MNYDETEVILVLLYSECGKEVPEMRKPIWAELLEPVPFELGMMAAKRMIRETKIYGEPQFVDYRQHVNHLHREAKRELKPQQALCSAAMAHMSAKDREAYQERHRPPEMPQEQTKRVLAALDIEAKRIPGGKSVAAIEAERNRQKELLATINIQHSTEAA